MRRELDDTMDAFSSSIAGDEKKTVAKGMAGVAGQKKRESDASEGKKTDFFFSLSSLTLSIFFLFSLSSSGCLASWSAKRENTALSLA